MMMRDPQQEPPVAYCAYCGGEIYKGEIIRKGDEGCIHQCCIPAFLAWMIKDTGGFAEMTADALGYDKESA